MPGGDESSWAIVRPVLRQLQQRWMVSPASRILDQAVPGIIVKMVHNGIEYGDMQLICEAYNLFKLSGFTAEELAQVFDTWNTGDLESYLIQITSKILEQKDPETGKPVVDIVMDRAGQKGTGRWTVMSGVENGIVISTINAAVEARILSSMKEQRIMAASQLSGPSVEGLQ